MEPVRLYDQPFSDLAPMGPEELFSSKEAGEIFDLLSLIQQRAKPSIAA